MKMVVFTKGVPIAGVTMYSVTDSMDLVWNIQTLHWGVNIVTHNHGAVLVPWHMVHYFHQDV